MGSRGKHLIFPFSAVVGQDKAKLALLCVAIDPMIGGVLLKGDKGTGKSTLVRALANVLPEIEIVDGCPFNCNPRNPVEMCDKCYERYSRGEELPTTRRRMRLVDMPLSTTIDRLVGTIDVERFMKEGIKALQPGILAEANRGVLYIDEVNLLDDYIADSLLDAAAMGWNIIEREGISFRHPSRFILVGSMNPEEGELRPQISDRFGLCVEISVPMNPDDRIEIVKRVEEFHRDPLTFYERYRREEEMLTEKIAEAREMLSKVEVSEDLLKLLADTIIELGVRTNRAEIVTVKTAKAIAALDGRRMVSLEDLERAMELSLPHRLREKPLQRPLESPPRLRQHPHSSNDHGRRGNNNQGREWKGDDRRDEPPENTGNLMLKFDPEEIDELKLCNMNREEDRPPSYHSSRDASVTVMNFPRGIPVAYIPPQGEIRDVDLYNSAVWSVLNGKRPPLRIGPDDVRIRVRRARPPTLWILLLDSSGSMAIRRRISIAKGIAGRLIEKGYVKRSKMALVVIRGNSAEVVVPPTRNYVKVLEEIEKVPTGGRTPLSSGLHNLLIMADKERMKNESLKVRAFLITDGRANVPLFGRSVKEEITRLGELIRRKRIELNIYDTSIGINPGVSYIPLMEEVAGAKVYGSNGQTWSA